MSWTRWARVAAITAATLAAWAQSAHAASTNRNSCQYSYDSYWRDMDVTLGGTPSVTGDTITLGARSVDAALPDWLAEYGYNFGLLHDGRNELPVRVWLATRATNTVQGVRYQEVDTVAETTITTASGQFVDATAIEYSIPSLGSQSWTARGGPVEFRQAGAGSLPALPVGPGGRMQAVKGSLFILAQLGEATFGLDCVPGSFIAQGAERVETTAAGFASVDAPSFSCLSALPAATNVAPVRLELVRERGLPIAHAGQPYAYAPAVSYRFGSAYLSDLFAAGRLAEGDNAIDLRFTAAVNGAVLTGEASVTVRVAGGGAAIDDVSGGTRLTAWTGVPSSATGFAPGALGGLTVAGVAGPVRPYGSLYARVTITSAGGAASRLSLDCVAGTVSIAGGGPVPAYSELGDQAGGDQGRYVIARYPLDPFAIAYLEPSVTPRATPTPTAIASVVPTAVATAAATVVATPAPTVVPRPVVAEGVASVRSTKLRRSGTRVPVAVRCAGETACRGTLRLRGLTAAARYTVRAGTTATVRLALSRTGRAAVRKRASLRVRVELRPSGGKLVARALTLRR